MNRLRIFSTLMLLAVMMSSCLLGNLKSPDHDRHADDSSYYNKLADDRDATPRKRDHRGSGSYSDGVICGATAGINRNAHNLTTPKSLRFDFDNDGEDEEVVIRFVQIPQVVGIKGSYGKNLLNDMRIPYDSGLFDEYGDIDEYTTLHAVAHDFDDDGLYELILMVASPAESYVTIFRVDDDDLFRSLGTFEVQHKIEIDGKHIIAPFGSQGLYEEYLCDV